MNWTRTGPHDARRWFTLRGLDAGPYPGDLLSAARAFLREEGQRFGIRPEDVENLIPLKTLHTQATEHLRLQQTYRGIPVFGAQVVITRRLSDGRITFVSSRFVPGISRSQQEFEDVMCYFQDSLGITLANNEERNETSTTWGDGDALEIAPDATLVYQSTAYPGDAGILTGNEGRVVFVAVNFLSIQDWAVARQLLENIAEFLLPGYEVEEGEVVGAPALVVSPVSGGLIVRYALPETRPLVLRVYDAAGRLRHAETLRPRTPVGAFRVTPALPAGVYFYRLEAGTWSKKGKVLLVR